MSSQILFNSKQYLEIDEKLDEIKDKVLEKKLELFEPTKKEILAVRELILDYIKKNKRIIYGGYALDKLLKIEDPKDGIYTEKHIADIDFYSPEPLKDLINICDLLFEKKFKRIKGSEALHKETYKIYVNLMEYCDITYVPTIIFKNMPIRTLDGFLYIDPSFMLVDFYRMLTDPLVSYWRIDKFLSRLEKIQRHFKLPCSNNQPEHTIMTNNTDIPKTNFISSVKDKILDYCSENKALILIGIYAYNYFIMTSKYPKYELLDVSFLEIISDNYTVDGLKIKEILEKENPNAKVKIVEFYPYFQFIDYSCYIMVDDEIIVKLYRNGGKCYPFKQVPVIYDFISKNKSKNTLCIGSVDLNLLYDLANYIIFFSRENIRGEEKMSIFNKNYYLNMYCNIITLAQYFFEESGKTVMEDTVFQHFIVECIGTTMMPEHEGVIRIERNLASNKPPKYSYVPDGERGDVPQYIFANISGNKITNPKNTMISEEKLKKNKKEESDENSDEKVKEIKN